MSNLSLDTFHVIALRSCSPLLGEFAGAAFWLFSFGRFDFHAGQFRVDHDASAVFANDDFLAHADVELALWRNLVEAATAGTAFYVNDAQTIV